MPASALDILRVFYRTGVPYLPVVDGDRLLGIISRDALTARASDASRAETEFDSIPEELFLPEPVGADVFSAIGSARHSPVLFADGQSGQLESSRVLAMIPARKRESPVQPHASRPGAPEEVNLWLSRLLLAAVPYPLYAIDLKGKTLFYNGAFEKSIIAHQAFRSVARCEKSFLELSRELLAQSIAEGKEKDALRGVIRETGTAAWMITLIDAGRVAGYLFAFEWKGAMVQDLFERMTVEGMDSVMDELEKGTLLEALGRTDYNISRTAELLQTRRTTLQSRMKRLRLPLKARAPRKALVKKGLKNPGKKTLDLPGRKGAKTSVVRASKRLSKPARPSRGSLVRKKSARKK